MEIDLTTPVQGEPSPVKSLKRHLNDMHEWALRDDILYGEFQFSPINHSIEKSGGRE